MTTEDHVLELLPAYAVGALESEEAYDVMQHVEGCWICRAELGSLQSVSDLLAYSVPSEAPRSDLKARLLRRIQNPPRRVAARSRPAQRPWRERLLPAWGLASLLITLALAVYSLSLAQRLAQVEVITSPGGMRAVALSASPASPSASGFVIIGVHGRNGALVVDGLPPLEHDREYQLWLVRNGTSTSGGVFSTDEEGYRGLRIEAPGSLLEYSSVEVTIEPKGGSAQPTGEWVLGGSLISS
jgi:anti-sigma-K factor RskA